jgi:hypothetical protein
MSSVEHMSMSDVPGHAARLLELTNINCADVGTVRLDGIMTGHSEKDCIELARTLQIAVAVARHRQVMLDKSRHQTSPRFDDIRLIFRAAV